MSGEHLHYALAIGLAIALVYAAFTDLKARRIDNWLTGAIALAAPLFWWAGAKTLWPDVAIQIALALGVFALFAALFAAKMMGGGDVKLLTALALWFEPFQFLQLCLVMALIGGLLTIVFAAWHKMRRRREKIAIPYGVAIAIAGIWILALHHLSGAANGVFSA